MGVFFFRASMHYRILLFARLVKGLATPDVHYLFVYLFSHLHYATSRKVAGLIPDGVIGFLN
jgi:hypothetical protein